MRKITHLLCLLFIYNMLNAQVLTPVQTTMITKITADWCPNCGTYGWNFTQQLKDKVSPEEAILWNVHHSGGLRTATSAAIANNLKFAYQPQFFVGTESDDLGVSSGNVSARISDVLAVVELNKQMGTFVSMGSSATVNAAKKVTVNSKVKFLEKYETGDFYIGAYLVKKNLAWTQAGKTGTVIHHSVLDMSLSPDAFGKKIVVGPVDVNKEFSASFSLDDLTYHNGKAEDTKIVTVLWAFKNGKYNFINARESSIELSSDVKDELAKEQVFDFTPVLENGGLSITLNQEAKNVNVKLADLTGKSISVSPGFDGAKSIFLSNDNIINGNYFITVETDKGKRTKQVYLAK